MKILNLLDYKILETKEDDNDINISLKPLHIQTNCKYCNSLNIRKKGSKKQFYFDIPIRNKRVGLTIKVQKYFCEDCKKTFQNNLPQISNTQNMTIRLLKHIQKQSLIKPFTHLAYEIGMSEGNIRKIFKSHTNKLKAKYIFQTPKVLGIDEIYLAGRPRAVITNIEERTIIEMFKDRNKDTILKYLRSLDNKEDIINVTIDMWRPYKDAVNTVLPNATIVIDKFHVLKMANEALEMYSKELRKSLLQKQRNDLKNDRFILLKRKSKLSDNELFILSYWQNNYETLAKMYYLKEQFFEIYSANTKDEAYKLYEEFEVSLTSDIKHYFYKLTRAVSNWHNEIFSYFDYPVTNAYTEAVNSVIRQVDRMGRSYSFETIRAKMLYYTKAHKNKPNFNKKNDVNLGVDILELSKNIENDKIKFGKS